MTSKKMGMKKNLRQLMISTKAIKIQGLTSLDGTYTYGMSASSHKIGTWVMTSIGDIFPAITQTLQRIKSR